MSLAPPWAKAAAVLGLKMQLTLLRTLKNPLQEPDINLEELQAEIDRIEAMKS